MTLPRRRIATILATACLLAGQLSSCGWGPPDLPADSSSTSSPPSGLGTATRAARTPGPQTPELTRAFEALPQELRHRASMAVLRVGTGSTEETLRWGDLPATPAWSTIKVPMVVATRGRDAATATRAITASDNEAAASLWKGLGGGKTAAEAVQNELRAGGDHNTIVQDHDVRPPYTPYGQTVWRDDDAVRYTASLPCRADAAAAYDAMKHIITAHRWGLGKIDAPAFKGGWGPSSDHGYVVRQIGVVPAADGGQTAVAVTVLAPQGYDQGVADITTLARLLADHRDELPSGRCAPASTSPSNGP
ncbi:hypothetical protein KEM60_01316 [Austwickia sp. TVS 96-490-7B]|uniref:hypothetical protein n=1 Tax=Austwickia sp. TVS 96-490-7B TaxID=2830843 RepID=UPI001C579882|nr:hypothetical protein [Austwickia sp. TVS 96-490-7B]MBW3085121.1 hypothetical protein [Austwickia sp. TVS 96-490-7B]